MHVRRVALCNVIHTLILHYTRTFYIKSKFMENAINCLLFLYGTFKIKDQFKNAYIYLKVHVDVQFIYYLTSPVLGSNCLIAFLRNLSFALSLAL